MAKPDYSTWLTKAQAADAIGVSTKLVEQLAKEKKIQSAKWKRPEGGAWLSVYHPDDVTRLRTERNPDAPPFVLPAAADESKDEAEPTAAIARRESPADFLQVLAGAFESASQNSENRGVRIAERIFLTIPEAAAYSGLPRSYLRQLMKDGKLPGMKTGAGWRIRRVDLEKL